MLCRFSDFEQDMWSLYNLEFGDQTGKSTGWQALDEVYRVSTPYLYTLYAFASSLQRPPNCPSWLPSVNPLGPPPPLSGSINFLGWQAPDDMSLVRDPLHAAHRLSLTCFCTHQSVVPKQSHPAPRLARPPPAHPTRLHSGC